MIPDRYTRTTFPADTSSYGDVRYLDPDDESRVLRTIPAATLRAKTLAKEKAAEAAALKLLDGPETRHRGPAMNFTSKRKPRAAA